MNPMQVLVLSDGRPGHFNQAKGVVRALEFFRPVEVDWLDLRLRSGLHRPLLRSRLTLWRRPVRTENLRRYYRLDHAPKARPDLIVSGGGNTVFANAWLARSLGCRNLFIGKIRGLAPGDFWRILYTTPMQPSPPYFFWPLVPVPIVPEELAERGRQFAAAKGLPAEKLWTLLVGGNGGGYTYTREDWNQLAAGLRRTATTHGIRWLVITSRRTGLEAERILSDQLTADSLAALSFYSKDKGAQYADFLGTGQRVFATEDSGTMLTEAVYTRKPVVALRPRSCTLPPAQERFLDQLTGGGFLQRTRLADWATTDIPLPRAPDAPAVPSLRELGRYLTSALAAPT